MDGFRTATCPTCSFKVTAAIKAPGSRSVGLHKYFLRAHSLRGYSSVADTWTAFYRQVRRVTRALAISRLLLRFDL